MNRKIVVVISCLFLIYGAIRFGVSSVLLMQSFEVINYPDFKEATDEIAQFLIEKNPSSLFAFSSIGYLSYLWILGLLLLIGAVGLYRNHGYGPKSMASFLFLYAMLFVNFLTINPKIIHLLACSLLFFIAMKAKKDEKNWLRGRTTVHYRH